MTREQILEIVERLDKIRDEIEHKAHSGQWSDATMYGMLKVVAIIDKHKAEVEQQESEDCRECKKWEDCPCGKEGHESRTSQGYLIGECKEFEPQERSDKE